MNIKRCQKVALVATLMLQAAAASARDASSSTIDKIKSSQTLTLGYRADALPFSYRDSKGKPAGYAVDLCEAAAKKIQSKLKISQLKIEWKEVDVTNRFDEIEKGRIDLECSDTTNTTERLKLVGFGPTYFVGNIAIAVSDKSQIRRIDQLRDKTIAVVNNTTFVEALQRFQRSTGISVKETFLPSYKASLDAVARGAASATVLDKLVISSQGDRENFQQLRLLKQNIGKEAYAPVLKKDDAPFRQLIIDAFTKVMSSGKALEIYNQWFTKTIPGTGINYNLPISNELKALFRVQRPEANINVSHIQIFTDPSASGEELIQAYSQMEMLTGEKEGSIAITPEQTAAVKALVKPYFDKSAIVQRANGRRYDKNSFVPAYTDSFVVSDVQITKPSKDLIVARYNKQAQQVLPDSATLMSTNKSPRLTVFRWDPDIWNWLVVSHASFTTPLAAICNTQPIQQSPLESTASQQDYQLGIRLFEQYLKYLRAKNLKPVLDPEVQFQSASGRGFKENGSPVGTFQGTTYKDVVVTRNNDVLVLSLSVKHQLGVYQGAVEIKNDYNPILWTFRKDQKNEWKLISAATFAPPKSMPTGGKCVSAMSQVK